MGCSFSSGSAPGVDRRGEFGERFGHLIFEFRDEVVLELPRDAVEEVRYIALGGAHRADAGGDGG